MITALDHIALAVNDLDGAVDAYARMLGLAPNWIGGDGGARHAWFQLPNMALDVISPHGEGAFGDTIRTHLAAHGEGLWALAFTTPDIEAAQTLLARRGIPGGKPHSTRSTHDDGRKRYWTTASLDPAATGGLNILLTAPPRDGVAWPLSEPTGDGPITRLDHVVVHTPNPDRRSSRSAASGWSRWTRAPAAPSSSGINLLIRIRRAPAFNRRFRTWPAALPLNAPTKPARPSPAPR